MNRPGSERNLGSGIDASQRLQVLIDANVFIDDALMLRGPFRLLMEQARRGTFEILVPKIVIMETVNYRRKKLEDTKRDYDKATKEAARLFSPDEDPRVALDVGAQTYAYERQLRRKLKNAGARILDFPRVSHEQLARRASRAAKPFRDGDRGYRDALIWHSVLESAQTGQVAFVSNNTKDFAGPNSMLATELRNELIALVNDRDRVILYSSLKNFTDDYIAASERALDSLRELLARSDLYEQAKWLVIEEIEAELPKAPGLRLMSDARPENIQLLQVHIKDIEAVDAHELTQHEFVIDLHARVDAIMDFSVLKDEMYLVDNREDLASIMDWDSEEHYARGEVVFEDLVLEMEADFNDMTNALDDVNLIEVK